MNRKFALAALAALTVAGSVVPALAFERHRGFFGGPGVSVGLGFGDYRSRSDWDRGYYAPGAAVSVGFAGPGWGYDDWGSTSYVAASDYTCPCATRYRTTRLAPRYRYSSYAWGGYPYEDAYYSNDGYYGGDYYGGGYASLGFGYSDEGWNRRGMERGYGRRSERFGGRMTVENRDFRNRDLGASWNGQMNSRASFNGRGSINAMQNGGGSARAEAQGTGRGAAVAMGGTMGGGGGHREHR